MAMRPAPLVFSMGTATTGEGNIETVTPTRPPTQLRAGPIAKPPIVVNEVRENLNSKGQIDIADLSDEETLGSGSSGVVRRMRHQKTGQVYAMKVIPLGVEVQVQERIVQELNILHDSSSCPHIVTFHEACYYDGAVCVVLEYMDNGCLADVIAQVGSIPEPIIANIGRHVTSGLEFLHRKHLIHRDIKPSNILMHSR